MKLSGAETTLLAALLLTLYIHGSTSECTATRDPISCVQTMICEGYVSNFNEEHCRYNRHGSHMRYQHNIIFNNIETTEFANWENTFYSYCQNRKLNLLSMQHNALIITPLIRTHTQLNIKYIDFSHNLFREFDLRLLHNVMNLETFDLSYNYISDLKGSTKEPNLAPMVSLSVLNLSHNQIESIEESVFTSFTGLRSLDLSHNNISYISFQSFIGLGSLTILNVSFNTLKEFNMALFELGSLEYLDVSFNHLTTLYKQDLMKAVHLKQLNIQNNNLKSLDPQVFSSLTVLVQLNMSYNYFGDSLNESLFINNDNLLSVDLSFNGLSSLVRNAFSSQNLETFEVTGNVLSDVLVPDYFTGMTYVIVLNLSHQYLTGVSNNTFTGMNSLEILNLSNNKISLIEYKAFAVLFNLTSIDLSHNRITVIDFDNSDLLSLNSLRVNHNLITTILNNTFENLNALEVLDISYNSIDHLCAKCLPLTSLRYLFLENNTFSKIDSRSFSNLAHVSDLDLSNFRLTKLLNDTFQGLDLVTVLNLSNNHLKVVDQSTFRGLMNLTTLDMSTNLLDKFTIDTLDLPNLLTLNLRNNRLSTIASLSGFHNLEVLELSNNKLRFSNDSFDSLPNLRVLKLSSNSLDEFSVPNSKTLSHLDLANNYIHTIAYSSNGTTSLREIIITSNKIQDIKLLNLARNKFLQEIYLNKNIVGGIDALSFKGIEDLTILDLSDNLISVLVPGIFIELRHLEVLNISHNRIKEINFGAFNGLSYLRTVDVSYNSLDKIHIDIFFPLTDVSNIILDYNKINAIEDINTFEMPSTTISLGGNPLDCRWLSSLLRSISSTRSLDLQALHNNFTGENFNGITCIRQDAQVITTLNNARSSTTTEIQHDLRPHLSNLTQSLTHILNKNISFPSGIPETYLAPYLLNVTNLLETILNKNFSSDIDKGNNVDSYTEKHYNQIETYMQEILNQLKQKNSENSISSSQIISLMNNSKEISVKLKENDGDSIAIKELKDEILQLKNDLKNSIIARYQKLYSFVANVTRYLDENKLWSEPVGSTKEKLSPTASEKLAERGADPYNYDSRIKLSEAFVVVILIILLSVIAYKVYLAKVLSGSRRLQRQSIQNIPME